MKRYIYNGRAYWYEPEKAPEGAVEADKPKPAPVTAAEPEQAAEKAEKPANKARKASNKSKKAAAK